MKKIVFILISFFFALLLVSCDFFAEPVYRVSRDISSQIGSMPTSYLVDNVDKFASDPEKTADVLNVLSNRDQEEITKLSPENKEKILEAGIGAILPTSQLGETVDTIMDDKENTDYNKVVETLCNGSSDVNTRVLETILKDKDVLTNTDTDILTLSAASLIVATIKSEAKEDSVDAKMEAFKAAASAANSGENFDENKFEEELSSKGFSSESIESLTVAMDTTHVLTGTAGEGMPNRKEDVSGTSFGGYDIGELLDKMTGGNG